MTPGMQSVTLALIPLGLCLLITWIQARDRRSERARNVEVTMQYDAPCPRCQATPVELLAVADGQAVICPHCGHQTTEGAADIESVVDALGNHDPARVAAWRKALGLEPKAS